jgi:hypothetical protein
MELYQAGSWHRRVSILRMGFSAGRDVAEVGMLLVDSYIVEWALT